MTELRVRGTAWLRAAEQAGQLGPEGPTDGGGETALLYPSSLCRRGEELFALLRIPGLGGEGPPHGRGKALGIWRSGGQPGPAAAAFEGEWLQAGDKGRLLVGPLSRRNAGALRRALPFTAPSPLRGQAVTIGVGDRLGVAGPGHLRLFARRAAAPVLAQQSVRELELTGRSYEEVLDAATWAVFQEGFRRPWGADGDHLKSEGWVRKALGLGFTMITADVSDYIRRGHLEAAEGEVLRAYGRLPAAYRRRIEAAFLPSGLSLDTGETVLFGPESLARTALVYREAVEHAVRLYRAGCEALRAEGAGPAGAPGGETGRFDFELSVDETEAPTTPEAHAFVALEVQAAGVELSSLAPRFVGEFQKGIDYIGDPGAFERSLATHAALARRLGYRLSVHSGSDKFAVFPIVGRLTRGRFHLKTAGTNWLEALRVLARREPGFYRELHARALEGFAAATRYYHVGADPAKVPPLEGLADGELPGLFEDPDARQLLHITYGELLKDSGLRERLFALLERHMEEYWRRLEAHVGLHLDRLGVEGGAP